MENKTKIASKKIFFCSGWCYIIALSLSSWLDSCLFPNRSAVNLKKNIFYNKNILQTGGTDGVETDATSGPEQWRPFSRWTAYRTLSPGIFFFFQKKSCKIRLDMSSDVWTLSLFSASYPVRVNICSSMLLHPTKGICILYIWYLYKSENGECRI